MKDSIDFGSMDISTLFRKLLVPTVLGMVSVSYTHLDVYKRQVKYVS